MAPSASSPLHPMRILSVLASLLLVGPATAQTVRDMTVLYIGDPGSLDDVYWGASSGIRAYNVGTTSCNEGNVALAWVSQEVHIAQNMFRVGNGRVEQLGYSWLKLGFCAVNEPGCGTCQSTSCSTLGVGCADTYWATLNDGQDGHDKAIVNPTLGRFTAPQYNPTGNSTIRGRLQVQASEMGVTGYQYLLEGQYVYEGDAQEGNNRNNVTWRPVNVSNTSLSSGGSARRYQCAIEAWQEYQPSVQIEEIVHTDEPTRLGDAFGYYVLGWDVTNIGGGQWRYEYALQNLTSDQAAASFVLPLDCNVSVSNAEFRGVSRHSGTPWDNTPWSISTAGGQLTFECTQAYGQNQNANALRWGELFNFSFEADASPVPATIGIGLFKPGSTMTLLASAEGPCQGGPCLQGMSNYCIGASNSFNQVGCSMGGLGTTSLSANDLVLQSYNSAPNQNGIFFYGPGLAQNPFGDGFLCVSGAITRANSPTSSDFFGFNQLVVDNTAEPFDAGAGQLTAGSTFYIQYWYRDPGAGGSGFNLSDGLQATFCP